MRGARLQLELVPAAISGARAVPFNLDAKEHRMKPNSAASSSWCEDHQREDGSYDAEVWGEVDENGERVQPATAANNPQLRKDGRLRGETRHIPYVPPRPRFTDEQRVEALERIADRAERGEATPLDEIEAAAHTKALRRG